MRQKIYDLLIQKNTLQEFTDAAARLIDTPFWVMDESFRFLSVSRNPSAMDFARELLLRQSIYGWAAEWMKNGLDERIRKNGKPLYIEDSFLKHPVAVLNVMNNETLLGRMTFFVNDDQPADAGVLEQITSCCGVYLRDQNMDINAGLKEQFLLSLIQGKIKDSDIHEAVKVCGFVQNPPYRLIAIATDEDSRRNDELIKLSISLIRSSVPQAASILLDGRGYVLCSEKDRADRVLREQPVNAGFSFPFQELSACGNALIQAQFALENRTGAFTAFEDVYTEYFLSLLRHNVDMPDFLLPKVRNMLAYDEEYGTHYLETVSTYYSCGCSKEKTAKALDLHINTVKYRLRQCEELFAVDLKKDQAAIRIALLLSK